MTRASKIFLTISLAAFMLSFTAVGSDFGWGILKPLSAVTFILFFITNVLAKEVAFHDEEQRRNRVRTQQARDSRKAPAARPVGPVAPTLEPVPAK